MPSVYPVPFNTIPPWYNRVMREGVFKFHFQLGWCLHFCLLYCGKTMFVECPFEFAKKENNTSRKVCWITWLPDHNGVFLPQELLERRSVICRCVGVVTYSTKFVSKVCFVFSGIASYDENSLRALSCMQYYSKCVPIIK